MNGRTLRQLTVHLHLRFNDLRAESADDARDAVKQALVAMEQDCHREMEAALEAIGATDVTLETVVF